MNNPGENNQPARNEQQIAPGEIDRMVNLDVKNQPTLSVRRTFEIALNGMRYRLFRSVLTVMVITVAIAFMMNVVCEAISMRAISATARARTEQSRLASLWSVRLSMVGTQEGVLREIGGENSSSLVLDEDRQFAQLPANANARLRDDAREAVRYMDFFAALPYSSRRILLHHAIGTAIFDQLQPTIARTTFFSALSANHIRLPDTKLNAFLDRWGSILSLQTNAVLQGHQLAINRLTPLLAGRPLHEALMDADQAFGQQVHDAGFAGFDNATRRTVALEARQSYDISVLEDSIQIPEMRQKLAGYMNIMPGDLNLTVLWETLQSKSNAEWYLGKFKENGLKLGDLTADRVVGLAAMKRDAETLDNALTLTADTQGGFLGLGTRMTWLVFISLLVCVVGISNAMLMSVTERFREIATLKCLGALDGFIMMLFLTEAGLLGLVGGAIGGLLGSVIGFGRMSLTFGIGLLFTSFPAASWGIGLLLAVLVGLLLAAFAGVYPSYLAARLAPMEAMRIE